MSFVPVVGVLRRVSSEDEFSEARLGRMLRSDRVRLQLRSGQIPLGAF